MRVKVLAQPAAGLYVCAGLRGQQKQQQRHRHLQEALHRHCLYVDRWWHIQCGFAVNTMPVHLLCWVLVAVPSFVRWVCAHQADEWQLLEQQQLCGGWPQHLLPVSQACVIGQ